MKMFAILQLPPPIHGAAAVGKQIKESSLINSSFDIRYLRISTKSSSKIFKGNFFKFFRIFSLFYRVLFRLLRSYEIVYITPCASGVEWYKDFIICQLAKLLKKKVVLHYHNKGITANLFVPRCLKKILFNKVDVILLSPLLKYDLKGLISDENIYYCPNGIDFNNYSALYIKETNNLNQIRFLFLSNMIRTKGVFILLEACYKLHRMGYDFECNFVGPWYEDIESEFHQTVDKYDLHAKVSYLGPKYEDAKLSILKSSDVFIFPTYYPDECFPLVLLEAMSVGLPIISTNEGAIPDIVQDGLNGFIVPKKDSHALANAMGKLIQEPLLRNEMSLKGKEYYLSKFTSQHFEKNFVDTICNILKK